MRDLKLETKHINDRQTMIEVSGYIDTQSANKFGEYIINLHNEEPTKKLIIDFNDVEMITSAGIRQLLLFEKSNYNYQLINVKKEVATVLDLTGMSDILKLEDKVLSISTKDCKALGKGFSSAVYKLDDERIAKVYYNIPNIDQAIRERMIAKEAFIKGVPTEICFCLCEAEGMPGLIYELVDANTLLSIMAEDDSKIESSIEEYVDLVKQMHTFNGDGITGIYNEKQRLGECISKVNNYLSPEYVEKLKALDEEIPDSNVLLHGDIHPANVMVTEKGMLFIDLSEMSVGDPIYDLVYLYRTLMLFSMLPDDKYALNRQQEERLWNSFFNEYYKDKDEDYKQRQLHLIKVFGLVSIASRFLKSNKQEIGNLFLNELKKELDK